MTPAARLSAAIAVLDRILTGQSAEVALTNWGRASRFAGSGDRAAVRDIVFDCLRCRRSFAALGGGETGRGLVLGHVRASGQDEALLFTGEGHAPAPVHPEEAARLPTGAEALDLPDWLETPLRQSLGADFEPVAKTLRQRAPVFLRVNLARMDRAAAAAILRDQGIVTLPHPLADSALEVTEGARRIQQSAAYLEGLVELQDASSQSVVAALPLAGGMRALDLCAGGGGKTLAMAARAPLRLFAHDADPRRMRDLPPRAARAGIKVTITENPEKTAPYDLILADAPCSGSGSWRRDPEGKWRLTPARLAEVVGLQATILDRAARMLRPGGVLAYATCSLLEEENGAQVARFLERHPGWTLAQARRLTPMEGGDGFFIAQMMAPE